MANFYADLAGDRPARTNVSITKLDVHSTSELTAVMASNGGQALPMVPKRLPLPIRNLG
ncbi:glycoside hydrolase family 97 C-terminal domain-containing protein [Paenibacillus sp. N4]|uniref:glycoside hydrolase family 97 C-terminal domain-containing protein n=1 Tax=Paenibacillus vietnamensis TaxID=2590547 RepID=UPI001CD18410|nr:glycoside hydrolase family 97 C-terminal domain-containing protein [Paenibacillus vietnamensis]MCA0758095.1 glycoside hydrolase family 97 C-terminal domain-containing protein [Paenibacillus vietnamensis]